MIDVRPQEGTAARAGRRAAVLAHVAAVAARVDRDDRAAARGTPHQAGKEGAHLRATLRRRAVLITRPSGVPCRGVDDAQVRHIADLPLLPGPIDAAPLSGLGILQPLPAVPDQATDVDLGVQKPSATSAIADQGGDSPGAAARALDPFRVEAVNDGPYAAAIGVFVEDPPHDRRLLLVDHQLAAAPVSRGLAAVAVADAADVVAAVELAGEPAVRLLAQVIEVQLVHQPASNAHHLAAARLRVVAVCGAHQAQSAELQPLHHLVLLADVPAQAIKAFHDEQIEAAGQRVCQHGLAAFAQGNGHAAADPFVGVLRDYHPAFGSSTRTSRAQLVIDRGFALPVGAVPRVEHRAERCRAAGRESHRP
nr:hypothetical protein [Ramlibacter humi]